MNQKKNEKKKINWKRTFKNNGYMIGIILRVCPAVFWLGLIITVLGAANSFVSNIYLYQYALNALQEGKALKTILLTLGVIVAYMVVYAVLRHISIFFLGQKRHIVEGYIQNMLQKKAAAVDLACFENSSFYDTYVKATDGATDRAYAVMNNLFDVIWVIINVATTATLVITINPVFLLFALVPAMATLLVGKRRNRLRHEYDMRMKEVTRQKDYVRRTFYLKDFSKEMRLTEMWKVMYRRMHTSVAELKGIVKQYGYKMMFFRYLFDFIFDVVVDMGATVLAAYKTLVKKNLLLGDCFVVINAVSSVAGCVNYAGDRLSTTRMADRIYMFDNGRIVECGSHEELMAQNGKYAEMYRVQAKKYREAM